MTEYLILFLAAYFAATISASAGFGGALIFLPILANIVGIKEAVPVLTIAQLFGNGSRFWFGRHQIKWKPVLYFLSGSIPLSILGSYLYADFKADWLFKGIGVFLILIVVYRRLNIKKIRAGYAGMVFGGAITGFLSGIAGSAGPTGAAFFLGLNLTPVAYVASDAFSSLVMHFTKIIVYNRYSLINMHGFLVGAFAGVAMILGSYTGKVIISRVSKDKYVLIVEILIVISGIQMILTNSA